MTRRYEQTITVRRDDTRADAAAVQAGINAMHAVPNVEVTVGDPVDITPKSAADRAVDAVRDNFSCWTVEQLEAVRAAVGEDTP